MDNSVLSLNNEGSASAMDTSNNEADSEGEEPREEIILPSLGSGVKKQIVAEDDRLNVGSFEDKAVSLHYLARKLVSMFLLSEEKGELVSDRVSRVSVKTLTVNCLVQVAALCPQVWSLALAPGREDTLTNVDMSDLLLYLDHQDPGLRGAVARWVCQVIRGAGLESGGRLGQWFTQEGGGRDLTEIVSLLVELFTDTSSITLRQLIAGMVTCLPSLLHSDSTRHVVTLLDCLARLGDNQYWLVRLDLAHAIAEIEIHAATYIAPSWPDTRIKVLSKLLSDEDGRVRTGAVEAFVRVTVKNSLDDESSVASVAGSKLSSELHSATSSEAKSESTVFQTVSQVTRALATADTKAEIFGCLELVSSLARARPPPLHPEDWGLASNAGLALLSRSVKLLTASPPCQDLLTHSNLLNISSQMFAGLAKLNITSKPRNFDSITSLVASDSGLSEQAELLLAHLLRLLSILHHVLEEQIPSLPSSKPSLPSLPNSTLSPIKKKSSEPSTPVSPPATEKTFSFKEEKKPRGYFYGTPFYMKQYELVKASYNNFKSSLDPASEEKLLTFTNNVLDSFSLVLDYSIGNDIGKLVEECLTYVKSCLQVSANRALRTVQSLLRCLFKCNQPFTLPETDTFPARCPAPRSSSTFEQFIGSPYSRMTVEASLVVDGVMSSLDSTASASISARISYSRRSIPRNTDRSSLASYIRMFEPIVIKALKLYTVTSNVQLQVEVLQLLVTLVRLRVNYCLLDSDQIFIGFVTKQLESLQEAEITDCEKLIPYIFEFLVLLSYERYHSKTVIDIPRILQLCEGLAAGRERPERHVVPALEVVAVDLFERESSGDGSELETQREVAVNMLMKQMACPRIWDTVSRVLGILESEEDGAGEDKARKLSRQVVDVLVPLLCSHGVRLENRVDLDSLKNLLRSLSPGALRPCDKIMSSLLSCHADLASMTEVTSWLGFTIVTFLTVFHLSPEEAVLGRLQELGIMLGSAGSSVLEASMEESLSLSQEIEGQGQSSELTLSVFFLHVIGSGVSKLHQLVFCPSTKESESKMFLEQELSDLLLLHIYILQSGRCSRMARSMQTLARSGQSGALHNIDLITDLVMQLSHHSPSLVSQWLYILILLDKCPPPVWASCLGLSRGPSNARSHEQSVPASDLNQELVRRTAISILANRLVNNTSDGELLAWFLSSQIREIVTNIGDPNIREFVNSIHRQAAASGLFLESVSARLETMRSVQCYHNILCSLHNLHASHSGRLIVLLFNKFLSHPVLALSTKASQLACNRVELLLNDNNAETFVPDQLSSTEVASLKETLGNKALASRHSKLVALLNRLAMAFYDLSPLEMTDSSRKFNPVSVSGVSLDKSWYLQQVKRCCCGASPAPAKECARLLSNLSLSDIMLVMTSKDFKLRVLEECLEQGITQPDGRAPSIDSLDRLPGLLSDPDRSPGVSVPITPSVGVKEGPPLYRAASQVLLQHIRNVVELLPRPCHVYRPHTWWQPGHAEVRYSAKLDDLFTSWDGLHRVTQVLPSLAKLLTTYPRLPGRRPALPPHSILELIRFAVLCLELVKWTVASCRSDHLTPGQEAIISQCLNIAGLTFSNPHLSSALALNSNNTLAASAVLSLTDFVLATCPQLRLPVFPWPALTEALEAVSPPPLLVAGSCLARLLIMTEQGTDKLPSNLDRALPAIICLARLPQFSFLARAPPLAFSLGWDPQLRIEAGGGCQLSGNLDQDLLQEAEILRQVIWRINILGWTSKNQFEETWMCLLSVLNVAKDDLTTQEVAALAQTTSLVVSALGSLLVNTLALPVAGVPGARTLHHPRDSPHQSLLGGRGQQLTAIQNIIHQRLDAGPGLPVDSSVNLERAGHWQGGDAWAGYSPVPVTGYGPGQVSVSFLRTCVAYHEEGSEDRQSMASSVLPLFLILREENLAAAGLDTHSCAHFLTDHFSQWLAAAGQHMPLTVLTSAVRVMVMISDIFTQDAQFSWMLESLSDLYRVHPVEDELLTELLILGISKAVSVVGFIEPDLSERLKKGLEVALKSGSQSSRTAGVHSLLYLLQREECGEFYQLAVEHVRANLLVRGRSLGVGEQQCLISWALMFYILENCDRDQLSPDTASSWAELSGEMIVTAVSVAGAPGVSTQLYTTLLAGLERVVVAGLAAPHLDLIVKLATDLMTDWPPSAVLPATQLFLAAMYSSHSPLTPEPGPRPSPITDPETLMLMMEQMSILFDCVRRSGPSQAELLAEILPQVLLDFFPASDVVNRVISEFISPGQPHPALLAGVLKTIFKAAALQVRVETE